MTAHRRESDSARPGLLAVGIVFLVVLLAYVLIEGWPRLDGLVPEPGVPAPPRHCGGTGAILGTLWLMAGTAIIALPIGVLAAVYLEEYADRERWYNRLIELNIQISPPCRAWLRHPRARVDRAGPLAGPVLRRGGDHLGAADPAGDHHLQPRRFARCRTHCATARSPWAPPDGRPSGGQSCPTASRNRYRIDPGAVAAIGRPR